VKVLEVCDPTAIPLVVPVDLVVQLFLAGGGASTPSSAINDMYSLSILAFSENVCIGPELLFPLT